MDALHFLTFELQFRELVHILLYENHFIILKYQLVILKNIFYLFNIFYYYKHCIIFWGRKKMGGKEAGGEVLAGTWWKKMTVYFLGGIFCWAVKWNLPPETMAFHLTCQTVKQWVAFDSLGRISHAHHPSTSSCLSVCGCRFVTPDSWRPVHIDG